MKIRSMVAAAGLVACALLGGAGAAVADSGANGVATGSPGIVSGNVIQVPIQVPINLCGNSIDIIGLLNAASGNTCVNG
ncbi:chaplin [Streptomyces sp. NBC_01210]|uniref:chaplin n=1 Tax=Streptomyces sp. NBC_01210 TaxID=2903774 RepID=UPI002E151A79|nr:chaplin [Streptomyces sp. NBC_01210]